MDEYDLKAYQFNHYFPQHQNNTNEKFDSLASKFQKRKGSSLCDEDALPRYEISKMNKLAEIDLEDISVQN